MSGQLGELVVSLSADIARFQSDMGKAVKTSQDSAKSISDHFDRASDMIGKAGAALAGIAGVASLGALVKGSIDAADEMSKMSQKVGVATEELSAMNYAASLADVSTEQLSKGMGKLAKAMYDAAGDSGGAMADTFKNIGVSVTDASGKLRGTDQVMTDLAGKFAGMDDGAKKTALAMEIFGKSGADLIPMLNSGKEGLQEAADEARKLGLVLSTEAGLQAEEFNDNMTRMQGALKGVVNQVLAQNLPMMEKLSTAMVDATKDADGVKRAAESISAAMKLMASAGAITVGVFQVAGDNIAAVAAALTFAVEGEFKKAWQTLGYGGRDTVDDIKNTANKITAIWDDTADKVATSAAKIKKSRGAGDDGTVVDKNAPKEKEPTIDDPGFLGWKREMEFLKEEAKWMENNEKLMKERQREMQELTKMYDGLRLEVLELSGDYVAAEEQKQKAYRQSEGYMKLEAAALAGNADALQAMFDLEQKEAVAMVAATNKKSEEMASFAKAIDATTDSINKMNGGNSEYIDLNRKISEGIEEQQKLQNLLNFAQAAGRTADIEYYSKKIQLQDIVNQRLAKEIDLMDRRRVLSGEVVGFNNGVAIERDAYQNQMNATGYVTDASLTTNNRSTSNSTNVNISSINVNGGSTATGTGQNIAAEIRNGVQSYQFQVLNPSFGSGWM